MVVVLRGRVEFGRVERKFKQNRHTEDSSWNTNAFLESLYACIPSSFSIYRVVLVIYGKDDLVVVDSVTSSLPRIY